MIARNRSRFGEQPIGTQFHFASEESNFTLPITNALWRKTTDSFAVRDGEHASPIKVKKTSWVFIYTPDPTPEEKVARQVKTVNYRIDDMLSSAAYRQKELAEALAKGQDGWYATFTWSGNVEQQMEAAAKLDVATRARTILEHEKGGLDELRREATRTAMRYARYGNHSTSVVSNVMEEMKAAAWAEIAEACGEKI